MGRGATSETTSLERVLAVLRHEMPDRVPHFEWVYDSGVIAALTGGGTYWDLVEILDIDGVMVAPAYRKETIDGGLVRDEWGAVRMVGRDSCAVVVEERARIRCEADLAGWQVPDPDDPYRYAPIRAAAGRFGGRQAIILQLREVWSGVPDYMGYERALVSMIEQPELGVQVLFSGGDIANASGPLFLLGLWQSLLLPHYRRLVAAIHDAGLYHWKHSDGNLYPFQDSIVDAGSDGIDPIDPMGGMELAAVKARYGERVALKGNVDQVELLAIGPVAQVVERVKICIREAGARIGAR